MQILLQVMPNWRSVAWEDLLGPLGFCFLVCSLASGPEQEFSDCLCGTFRDSLKRTQGLLEGVRNTLQGWETVSPCSDHICELYTPAQQMAKS